MRQSLRQTVSGQSLRWQMRPTGKVSSMFQSVVMEWRLIDPTPEEAPVAFVPGATQDVDAFASVDGVTLRDVFDARE